jgi:hypothetical protein
LFLNGLQTFVHGFDFLIVLFTGLHKRKLKGWSLINETTMTGNQPQDLLFAGDQPTAPHPHSDSPQLVRQPAPLSRQCGTLECDLCVVG